jgi:serine/threonine-protein kinase
MAGTTALLWILCEILTGEPVFTGRSSAEMIRKSSRDDLAEAHARLEGCAADAELVALARGCLVAEVEDRPRTAGVVAARMTAYLTGVQERLRAAEVARAAESARAEEAVRTAAEAEERARAERRARRSQVGLAASLLVLSIVGGLSVTYYQQQRQERAAARDLLLGEAQTLYTVALKEPENESRWEAVLTAPHQAEAAIGKGADASAIRRIETLRKDTQAGAETARRDRALLDATAQVRAGQQDLGLAGADEAYARAFREADLDLDALTPAEAGARLKGRPASIVVAAPRRWTTGRWSGLRRSPMTRGGAARWRRPAPPTPTRSATESAPPCWSPTRQPPVRQWRSWRPTRRRPSCRRPAPCCWRPA